MSGKTWEELWWVSYVVLAVWIVNSALILLLLIQVDWIVHVQLYSFGLEFSKQWADSYWMATRLMMVFLGVPLGLSAAVFVAGFRRFRRKAKTIMAERKIASVQSSLTEKTKVVLEAKTPKIAEEKGQTGGEETLMNPLQIESNLEPEQENGSTGKLELGVIQPEATRVEQASPETEVVEVKEQQGVNDDMRVAIRCLNCGKLFNRPLVMLDFAGGMTHLINVCPFCKNAIGEDSDSKTDEKAQR